MAATMCTTSGTGDGGEARVRRQELRSAGDLDEARGAAHDGDHGERDQAGRQPPARPARPALARLGVLGVAGAPAPAPA